MRSRFLSAFICVHLRLRFSLQQSLGESAIDGNAGARHIAGLFGAEKRDGRGEFLGTSEASHGDVRCPQGVRLLHGDPARFRNRLAELARRSVSVNPGQMLFTRILSLPNSFASVFASPVAPARTAFESIRPSIGCLIETEVIVTRRPQRARCMCGITSRAK